MTTFAPSPMQAGFFDFLANGSGSAVLVAVAGSGKTTSCIEGLAYVPAGKSVKMLAFSAAIAAELNERIAAKYNEFIKAAAEADRWGNATLAAELMGNAQHYVGSKVSASTFHSLCFGAVRKALEGRGVRAGKPDGKKVRALTRDFLGEKSPDYEAYGDFVSRLVGLAKCEGIGPLVKDTPDAWTGLVDHHGLQLDVEGSTEERGVEIARAVLKLSNSAADRGSIDFDDMLYLVLLWNLRLWQNDYLFLDESQDTSAVRRAICRLALRHNGRLIAVGDPKQGIFGFAGATHDAIDLIKSDFRAVELPLTVSYRCAKNIVALAQTVVPYIEAHQDAPDGAVETISQDTAIACLGPHDAVVCRQTAPLVKLAYALIARGTGCKVLGKEIGEGLTSLVKKCKARGIDQLVVKLEKFRERETVKHAAKGDDMKIDAVNDRVDCVMVVVDSLSENDRTVPALLEAIDRLFSDTNGCLTLCTVHKSKGKEWGTVAILRPELMPSKRAKRDWEINQEQNLLYVAYTRAKQRLIFIETERKEK